jgi:hypothetical protein
MEEPNLDSPKTDIEDPKRKNARSDNVLPRCMKSKTERDAPKRLSPKTASVAPIRRKLLNDIDAP